jgi:hypothetical protein
MVVDPQAPQAARMRRTRWDGARPKGQVPYLNVVV